MYCFILCNVAGLTLSGNRIVSPHRALQPAELVAASNCSGVVVENNTVVHGGP